MRKLLRLIFLMIFTFILTFVGVAGLVYMFRDRELPLQSRLLPSVLPEDSLMVDSLITMEVTAAREDSIQQARIDSQSYALTLAQQQILAQRDSMNILIGKITTAIEEQEKFQSTQIDQLSKIFDAMRPDEAARVMEILDDRILVKVMRQLTERQAARILGALPPDRAQEVSEMFVKSR